jgi:hypothetical protein
VEGLKVRRGGGKVKHEKQTVGKKNHVLIRLPLSYSAESQCCSNLHMGEYLKDSQDKLCEQGWLV